VSSNGNEKHEQNLIIWFIPFLLALVGFGFVAVMAEIMSFIWPDIVDLRYYLGFFGVIMVFFGYFATARPESYERKRSRIPEVIALIFLSKLYTAFVLPWDQFVSRLVPAKFLEVNFFFAFILLYFVWVLARSAGNLALTMTQSIVDRELRKQQDESYLGVAVRESITGLKLIKYLFIPMIVVLIFVIGAEQSFQEQVAQSTVFKLKVNLFGGVMAAATIAMATLVLYLQKNYQWESERAEVEKDLGFKWVIWSLAFVLLFTAVAAFLPGDLSPVYFYIPNAIKALLPFMHRDMPTGPVFQQREKNEPVEPPILDEQTMGKHHSALLTTITATVQTLIAIAIAVTAFYYLLRVLYENSDELKRLVDNIVRTFKYFINALKSLFIKTETGKVDKKTLAEQVDQFFKRRKITYNKVGINEVRRLYGELLLEAESRGIRREAYATASEFAVVLENLFPERVQEIVGLTRMYEDARYNKDPDEETSKKAKGLFSVVVQTVRSYTRRSGRKRDASVED